MRNQSVTSGAASTTAVSQSQILEQLGVQNPTSQSFVNQITGNGRLQQYFNTQAALKHLPAPFDPSTASAIIQDILPVAAIAAVAAGPAAGAAAGAAGSGASAVAGSSAVQGAALFSVIGAAITSPLDFLKFIAWIFHPRNILRAVEFLIGAVLMIFGFNAALQARGERIEGFASSQGALSRSGLGRVATALGNAARSGSAPARPRSAPHRTRQRALTQRYTREEDLQRRRAKAPRPKK